ncbi:hydroxysteroid dehydrogenase-like protein 1 [Stomoxys calcitrans]|uniref:hydroxysteroid dehydrogenase-like protein 1 n=1 Tax=Stomoxys calcitrans TaxID=35570 RepID=UPI0027E36AD7|nr:hydroxysteroid dehydrogenase-like protein 1 [Stomoxys calcitrans]
MWCSSFFACLGVLAFLNYLYGTLKSPIQLLYHKWLRFSKKDISLLEAYGVWAAVTGSTDGIGKAYARQLARKGFNIVLIARNEEKMQRVAEEIENDFGVGVYMVKADFSLGKPIYEKLYQDLAKKPIKLLVNNVGIGHNPPGPVGNFSSDHLWDMINVNIAAATQLSRHFVHEWYSNGIKGCIVNISSGLEQQPCPHGAVYGASKAYLRSFTLALQHEVEHLGIRVQLVSPGFVVTKINNYSSFIMKGNLFTPQADQYAEWAVESIGKTKATTGYFWHGVFNTIVKVLPWWMRSQLIIIGGSYLVNKKQK